MKKTFIIWLLLLVNFCFSLNGAASIINVGNKYSSTGFSYIYSNNEIAEQKKESKLFQKYYLSDNKIFHEFFNKVNNEISKPASKESKLKFDYLFDNKIAPRYWYAFADLNKTLSTKKINNNIRINLNWENLFEQNQKQIFSKIEFEQTQLRFYNIIAKNFGMKNVLNLVQKAELNSSVCYFGKTYYYPNIPATKIVLNPDFANQSAIDNEYCRDYLISNMLNINVVRLYGQSLIFYAYNNHQQRDSFNNSKITDQSTAKKSDEKYFNYSQINCNCYFHDVTQSLIDFLLSHCCIEYNNNPVKKLMIPLLIVNSKISQSSWKTANVSERDEFFNEAFAKWLGTNTMFRDFGWELLNEYFMSYFKKNYCFIT